MSKGLGTLQRTALELTKDGVTLISPASLAANVGEASDSSIRSARRALQTLAKRGLITRHGFSGGTGHAIYGGEHARRVQLERAYVWAMSEFAKNQNANLHAFGTLTEQKLNSDAFGTLTGGDK
jgi:hypothetical protein